MYIINNTIVYYQKKNIQRESIFQNGIFYSARIFKCPFKHLDKKKVYKSLTTDKGDFEEE